MAPCSWTFLSSLPGNKFFRNPLRPLRRVFGERMRPEVWQDRWLPMEV